MFFDINCSAECSMNINFSSEMFFEIDPVMTNYLLPPDLDLKCFPHRNIKGPMTPYMLLSSLINKTSYFVH